MSIIKTSIRNIDSNFAKFDLALICEEKYAKLKHIDMVIYTMLKNQESLSIASVKNGNKTYVDSNGYIFISIRQDKLCKILRTTRPTLKSSLDRLSKCDLIEVVNVGNMKCNRIYVGNAETTITLGEYINKIGIELDEQVSFTPSIDVVKVEKTENKKVSSSGIDETKGKDNKNDIYNDSITKGIKKYSAKTKNDVARATTPNFSNKENIPLINNFK